MKDKQDELIELLTGMIDHLEKISNKSEQSWWRIILPILLVMGASIIGYNFNAIAKQDTRLTLIESNYWTSEQSIEYFVSKWQYYQVEEDEHRILRKLFLDNDVMANYIFGDIDSIGIVDKNMRNYFEFKTTTRGEAGK
jgi:hypothetical protein